MSRKSFSTTTTIARSPGLGNPSTTVPTDICPVCKRVRYLNNDMKFQIHPDCYHPMCSQCVQNIFKSGPAQCPYAQCTKTLRLRGFRDCLFADLTVEREVDIRRRVGAVFNNTQDDFETLRDYNNYLQDVEDLTFALVSGTEEETSKAEEQLTKYENEHKARIEQNRKRARETDAVRKKREAEAEELEKARAKEREAEDERLRLEEEKIVAEAKEEVLDALARGEGNAEQIRESILKKKREKMALLNSNSIFSSMLSIRGLRKKTDDDEDDMKPYDPFGGIDVAPSRFMVRDDYYNPWLEDAKHRDDHRITGYSTHEYMSRAMFDAFGGLGVVINEEKKGSSTTGSQRMK